MERRGQPPHSAPLSAASGPATRKRPIAVLTLQGSPGEGALVIAGTSWEAKGRGLQADRPLRGADTSPPRLREQLGKFSGAGKPQKRRECDATSPTPVRVGQSNPRQWELFPLSLPAPRCSHGAGRLRLGRCMNPRLLLASSPPPAPQPPNLRVPAPARALWLLGAPTPLWGRISSRPHPPHFPLCRPLPTRLRRSLPSPRPGKAEGCGGRGSRQPTPGWEGMGVVCGSSIGSGRARGREGGLMGRGRGVDSRCGGGRERGKGEAPGEGKKGGRAGRAGERGTPEDALLGEGGRGPGAALTFSRRSRSPSSSRCRPCARSSASSACCCSAWILRFTASRELRPAMARRRGGARSGRSTWLESASAKLQRPRPSPRAFACAGAAPAPPCPGPGRRRGDEVTRPGRRRQHRWGRA